jgi:hypothetical protein
LPTKNCDPYHQAQKPTRMEVSYDSQDDDVCDRHWTLGRICLDVIRRSPSDRCYESVVFA